MNISCVHTSAITELFRGIRAQMCNLITGLHIHTVHTIQSCILVYVQCLCVFYNNVSQAWFIILCVGLPESEMNVMALGLSHR